MLLHFVHTREFEASARDAQLGDEALAKAQEVLCQSPRKGVVISGTGGLRKLRIGMPHRGRRGGLRVIYYFDARRLTVYLLLAYSKTKSEDLSNAGKKHLRRLVQVLEGEYE